MKVISHPQFSLQRRVYSTKLKEHHSQANSTHVHISRLEGVSNLQLGLALGLLKDRFHLGGLHDVALDLELAAHEQALGIGLAVDELVEVFVGEVEGDYHHGD